MKNNSTENKGMLSLSVMRALCMRYWNPIGIPMGAGLPEDEYDSYLQHVISMVQANATIQEIDAYLGKVERDSLGLCQPSGNKTSFVQAVLIEHANKFASPYLNRLAGDLSGRTPVWLMRQAGRYLPEYRAIRAEAGGFWNLVYDPARAAAVTLQPVERFGMDAAILFSDILVLPHALGQQIEFTAGEGPVLEPVRDLTALMALNPAKLPGKIAPICETVERCRAALAPNVALIGFAGAPWTIAAYMIQGHGKTDFAAARAIAKADPNFMEALLDLIVSSTATYLAAQVRAGAQALQLFDSWAGVLDDAEFAQWVIKPTRRLVRLLREQGINTPLIGFPRGTRDYAGYANATGVTALQLDTDVALETGQVLARQLPVQGWIDPEALLAGGAALDAAVDRLKEGMAGLPWLCNLGHGVIKETPPEHVAQLVERLRQ